MFRINPSKTSREEKHVPNIVSASTRTKPITVSQPPVITKKNVNSDLNGLSFTGVDNTKTRRPQPRSNTKHDRVPSANSRGKKQKAKVSFKENQMKYQPNVTKPKKKFMGTVRFENDHVAAILGFGDLQWGNILITRVYFVEGLGHNLFSVGQFCDSNLEVAFRRDACFVRNLEGVDLLKGDRSINHYTINLNEMASASSICLMAHASSTKSWLWHQCLSHLNFGTINNLARNDLVAGLPKFKYHKEHLCPSCEQGKSKRASHPPKPVPNSRQRLHLLHMDLCGPMRIASINGKQYVWVIVDDYSRYTWVYFLRSKDEAPEVIIKFLKRITVLLQIYNRRTKKIMETMNVSFDELSAMAFEQCSSKPRLHSMTSGHISESPSSSAPDVDNLNNQVTLMDKTMLSKNITHLGDQVVARSHANFTRLLDFTGDVNLAMEASLNTQNAYKAASITLEESQNKKMMVSVKRVVDFSFQDVKELVTLVQNAREAIHRQGFKGNDTQQSCK
nr:retrovirus-related Pol polyprotein from transposon TNT 1-94 [Tanacetum cinerariifolium]